MLASFNNQSIVVNPNQEPERTFVIIERLSNTIVFQTGNTSTINRILES
jgi:hypothetical protein